MTIAILPARLANQIAAGEVVERPASVVKELVENSIDAGATKVHIDIERGGHKLIRIRDNGHGIDKEQLTLALSRHATSKLKSLDDLECIASLGFRGEALASISSVSRLTLSSKPASQETAWQAFAEGRDMAVQIQPTAHPNGTTIEVKDLFFNTPARRKFLRTEKTEFSHIDELVKRIALSRFDIAITLTHNQKVVRQYRARTAEQGTQRVAQVAGKAFATDASYIESGSDGLKLYGWVLPCGASAQSQYSYVNGRMMRDKLILHAIRQAFEEQVGSIEVPGFVIYLELDPRQVDVNVHPAKHEVRFHQGRLVHDFIIQAVKQAVFIPEQNSLHDDALPLGNEAQIDEKHQDYRSILQPAAAPEPKQFSTPSAPSSYGRAAQSPSATVSSSRGGYAAGKPSPHSYDVNQFYQALDNQVSEAAPGTHCTDTSASSFESTPVQHTQLMKLSEGMVLLRQGERIMLSHYRHALQSFWQLQIERDAGLFGKALLLPVRVNLSAEDLTLIASSESWLTLLGVDFQLFDSYLMVKKLPHCVYTMDVANFVQTILKACHQQQDNLQWWLGWLQQVASERYFSSDSFAAIVPKIENNPLCMQALTEKAVKIDDSIFKSILREEPEIE